jgi:putative RecB family exonuclease
MSLPLPASLSPSKVASFKDCGLAFRFSAIERLPEPPSAHAAKGTLVHRALELLMWEQPAGNRSLEAALACLGRAGADIRSDPEYGQLDLGEAEGEWLADAEQLVRNYFELENPDDIHVIGTELRLSTRAGPLTLRGVIDRLELDADGQLVVTDYKTGRAPGTTSEQARMGGVHFYAFLCERLLGRRPSRVQLLHLREPVAISTVPSPQSIRGLQQQAAAVWTAVQLACEQEDFRPSPGPRCHQCAYRSYCPAFGGDPSLAMEAGRGPAASSGEPVARAGTTTTSSWPAGARPGARPEDGWPARLAAAAGQSDLP